MLTSIEHDPAWAAFVRNQLEREDLDGVVDLLVSPLEPNDNSWSEAPWYAAQAIAALADGIELLLVDGPPGYGEGMSHSRYPALPALGGLVAESGLVFLDDADREPEREIVERWSRDLPEWSFDDRRRDSDGVRLPLDLVPFAGRLPGLLQPRLSRRRLLAGTSGALLHGKALLQVRDRFVGSAG